MAGRRPVAAGTLFLDSEGLGKAAAGDDAVRALLIAAQRRRARVVTSVLSLTETLRGHPRDAAVRRIVAAVQVVPVDDGIAVEAGELLGRVTTRNDAAVDAVMAVTAARQPAPVVVLTSDPIDLGALTELLPAVHDVVRV